MAKTKNVITARSGQ